MRLRCCTGQGGEGKWRYLPEAVAVIIAATAVPLVADWIGPNWIYGFRTPQTMASPEEWYRANRLLGWYMILSQALAVASMDRVTRAIRSRFRGDRVAWGVPWACFLALAGIGGCALHYATLE